MEIFRKGISQQRLFLGICWTGLDTRTCRLWSIHVQTGILVTHDNMISFKLYIDFSTLHISQNIQNLKHNLLNVFELKYF